MSEVREPLPPIRDGARVTMRCMLGQNEFPFEATYNWFPDGRICEVFCRPFRTGAELETMLDKFCIVLSIALRHGARLTDIAKTTGDVAPVALADLFGAVIRGGIEIEEERMFELAAGVI